MKNISDFLPPAMPRFILFLRLTVSRLKMVSTDLVYLLSALVLTFITIAVPVQLDGQVVTLIWTAEAAILFWIGRTKLVPLYEYYSFLLMFLASVSLLLDWQQTYYFQTAQEIIENYYPFFNGIFLTSIIFSIAFAFIFAVNRDENYEPPAGKGLSEAIGYIIPAIALVVFYNAFRMEIGNFYNLQYLQSEISNSAANMSTPKIYNYDLKTFSFLWQVNYTMLFLTLLAFVNIQKFKNRFTALMTFALSIFVLTIFLTAGLYFLGELRENYMAQHSNRIFHPKCVLYSDQICLLCLCRRSAFFDLQNRQTGFFTGICSRNRNSFSI